MCFLFKDVIEIRKKLLENEKKNGTGYVGKGDDPDKLAFDTRTQIKEYLKQRELSREK